MTENADLYMPRASERMRDEWGRHLTGYDLARAAGLSLRRFQPGNWQLHNGAAVLGIIHTSPQGYSAHTAPAHTRPDAPVIARNTPGGWAYIGRSATLRGAVRLAIRAVGR